MRILIENTAHGTTASVKVSRPVPDTFEELLARLSVGQHDTLRKKLCPRPRLPGCPCRLECEIVEVSEDGAPVRDRGEA